MAEMVFPVRQGIRSRIARWLRKLSYWIEPPSYRDPLVVTIEADTSQFMRGMDEALEATKRLHLALEKIAPKERA